MGNTEKQYSRVKEAEEIIKNLCAKQPEVLWCVRPENVAVLGIENKERPEKNTTLAKIKPVKGCEKAILQDNNIPIRYCIEIFWSDFNTWTEKQKQWILLHELLHIHHEVGKSIKHDCEDWRIILSKVGVEWWKKEDLPDLLNDDVKFDLNLRPSLKDIDEDGEREEDDDGEEKEEKEEPEKDKVEKEDKPAKE